MHRIYPSLINFNIEKKNGNGKVKTDSPQMQIHTRSKHLIYIFLPGFKKVENIHGVRDFWVKKPSRWQTMMKSLFELVNRQNKILELVTRDLYLNLNSRVSNSRFLSKIKISTYQLNDFNQDKNLQLLTWELISR